MMRVDIILFLMLGRKHSIVHHSVLCQLKVFYRYILQGWKKKKKPSLPSWLRFYQEGLLHFVKCVCWDSHMIFSFLFLQYVELHWFLKVKPNLHTKNKPHLVMMYYLFSVVFIDLINFVQALHLCSWSILLCSFLFLWCLCLVLPSG